MLSKRSKIIAGLLSLAIIGSLSTTVLATQYHHEYYVEGWGSAPLGGIMRYFKIEVDLSVNSEPRGYGLIITSYSNSYSFWSEGYWIFWPFWYYHYFKFVNVVGDIEYTLYREQIIAVKYSVEGKVQSNSDSNKYAMFNVWVKIWASGVKEGGASVWDDNLGMLYFTPS